MCSERLPKLYLKTWYDSMGWVPKMLNRGIVIINRCPSIVWYFPLDSYVFDNMQAVDPHIFMVEANIQSTWHYLPPLSNTILTISTIVIKTSVDWYGLLHWISNIGDTGHGMQWEDDTGRTWTTFLLLNVLVIWYRDLIDPWTKRGEYTCNVRQHTSNIVP